MNNWKRVDTITVKHCNRVVGITVNNWNRVIGITVNNWNRVVGINSASCHFGGNAFIFFPC